LIGKYYVGNRGLTRAYFFNSEKPWGEQGIEWASKRKKNLQVVWKEGRPGEKENNKELAQKEKNQTGYWAVMSKGKSWRTCSRKKKGGKKGDSRE